MSGSGSRGKPLGSHHQSRRSSFCDVCLECYSMISSIRQKSPQVKGSQAPEGTLTPHESSDDATVEPSLESQQKQRRNDRSWAQRFNGTVFSVLFLFAFIYGTVTLCVVRHKLALLRHTSSPCQCVALQED